MKKFLIFILSLMILLIGSTGCSQQKETSSNSSKGKIVMGFAQNGAESSWKIANSDSMKSAAEDAGIELIFESANDKLETQIATIRGFIAKKVDVIAFTPITTKGWEQVLGEAKKAGIAVILINRTIETSDETLYSSAVIADNVQNGKNAGKWVLDLAKNATADFNVVEITGSAASSTAIDRKKGFAEIISGNTNIKIIDSKAGNFAKADGKKVAKEFLDKYGKKINVIYAHNDDMAFGAIEAMEEAGLVPGKDIQIISIDATKAAFQNMISGKLNATVENNPLFGEKVMSTAKDLASKKTVDRLIWIRGNTYTPDNAAKELPNRKY